MAKKQVRKKRAPKLKVKFRMAPKGTFEDVKAAVSGAGFTVTPLAAGGEGMPKPIPGYIETRLKEDANADTQVRLILKETAHKDLRSTRAALLAYDRPHENIIVAKTSNPERHIVDQLVENCVRRERAAIEEIITEWARVYEIDPAVTYQLKQLMLRVRGEATRDIIDNTATGHYEGPDDGYAETGDFIPFRPSTEQKRPRTELSLAE